MKHLQTNLIRLALVPFFLLLLACEGYGQGKCLIVSDIHLNPFYSNDGLYKNNDSLKAVLVNTPVENWEAVLSTYYKNLKIDRKMRDGLKDSNYVLVKLAIDSMYNKLPNPAFILIAGDFVWHGTPVTDSVLKEKNIKFISGLFREKFGAKIPIIPILGNNDAEDHNKKQGRGFLEAFAQVWSPNNKKISTKTFKKYGLYSYRFNKLKIVGLNSNLVYSVNNYPAEADSTLSYLGRELSDKSENVWVIFHVPPGNNAFDPHNADNWQPGCSGKFYDQIIKHYPKVRFIVASHTHFNEYKVICDVAGRPVAYIHTVPSIGMDHGNDPSYEVATFDRNYKVTDETNYFLDLNDSLKWKPLPKVKGLDTSTPSSILSYLSKYASSSSTTTADYLLFYNVWAGFIPVGYKYFADDILTGTIKAK